MGRKGKAGREKCVALDQAQARRASPAYAAAMATYRLESRIALVGARDFDVIVNATPDAPIASVIRTVTEHSLAQAEARRDHLVVLVGQELRLQGHQVLGMNE